MRFSKWPPGVGYLAASRHNAARRRSSAARSARSLRTLKLDQKDGTKSSPRPQDAALLQLVEETPPLVLAGPIPCLNKRREPIRGSFHNY